MLKPAVCLFVFLYVCMLTMVKSLSLPALLERNKRFLTPTTYPTPTLTPTTYPIPPILSSNPLTEGTKLNQVAVSAPISCPVKRDTYVRRVKADTELLRTIFLSLGGIWDTRYLATDEKDADKNFVDMLLGSQTEGVVGEDSIIMLKSQIKTDLKKIEHSFLNTSSTPTSQLLSSIGLRARTERVNSVLTKLEKIKTKRNMTMEELSNDLRLKSNIQQLARLETNSRRNKRSLSTNGKITAVEYCLPRGSQTPEGFMHMCSTCAMTTTLSENTFPRLINEAACDAKDCECLTVDGTSHGKCQQRVFYLKMMRKTSGGCRLTIQNGQRLVTHDWELYNQPINVGCECVIDKRSIFSPYIPKP